MSSQPHRRTAGSLRVARFCHVPVRESYYLRDKNECVLYVYNVLENVPMMPSRDINQYTPSTQTVIIPTNIEFSMLNLFNVLPCKVMDVPEFVKERKYGFRNWVLKNADTLIQGTEILGVLFMSNRKGFTHGHRPFRNAMTVDVFVIDKIINVKLPRVGNIQLTGVRSHEHVTHVIQFLWGLILPYDVYRFVNGSKYIEILSIVVMTNINFKIPFKILREKLHSIINEDKSSPFVSSIEFWMGYPAVKIVREIDINGSMISFMTYIDGEWQQSLVPITEYSKNLNPRSCIKFTTKKRYVQFFVFHSGSVIMTGTNVGFMTQSYEEFITLVSQRRDEIEELNVI
jgi:hypothetical protein